MTREEIEQLDGTEPNCFETDREEWWYNIGLKEGLETADQHPRKGLVDIEDVCKFIKRNLEQYCAISEYSKFLCIDLFIKDLRKAMED